MIMDNVFDIDGTLTIPGYDLWLLTTKNLARDENEFLDLVDNWKQSFTQENIIESSRAMMEAGVNLYDYQSHHVKEACLKIVLHLSKSLTLVRPKAIELIKEKLHKGEGVCFSTANYVDAARGFLDALVTLELLTQLEASQIEVQGSTISKHEHGSSVSHINVAENKTVSMSSIKSAYGDDPTGNDRGLASIAEDFYVIDTPKNKSISQYKRLVW